MISDGEEIKYRNKITYLSFVLALIVVVRHTVNIEIYNIQSGALWFIESLIRSFSEVAVPTFFVLSGYLFFVNFQYSKLLTKWKTRFFSVVLPYLIWNVAAYLFYQAIAIIPFVRGSLNQDIEQFSIKMLLLNAVWGYHNITWFLRYLILYIIVTPLIYFLLRYKISMLLVLPLVVWGGHEQSLCYYWLYYLLGTYTGIHFSDIVKGKKFSQLNMIAAAIILFVCSTINMQYPPDRPNRLLEIICIICVWVSFDFLRTEENPKWWAKISFFIYCTHSMILESTEKLFLILLGRNMFGAVVDLLFAPIITFVIILTGAYILQKIPRLWKVLNGNRI